MSAAAQPVSTAAARPARKPSGWDQLKTLLPYVKRYKGMVSLGMLTLAMMGLVGALPTLILAEITDCIQGSASTLPTLQGATRRLLNPLFSIYSPQSAHALQILCLVLMAAMLVKGFLSFWTRWILIGVSREIEYDLRNDLLRLLPGTRSRILCAESHGRFDVARHERLERRAHGARPGNHVQRHDRRDHGAGRSISCSSFRRDFRFGFFRRCRWWRWRFGISGKLFTGCRNRFRACWALFPHARRRISPAFA